LEALRSEACSEAAELAGAPALLGSSEVGVSEGEAGTSRLMDDGRCPEKASAARTKEACFLSDGRRMEPEERRRVSEEVLPVR
jgi:hypothetical protein